MPTIVPSPAAHALPRTRLLIVNSTLHIGGAEQVAADLVEHINPATIEASACYLKEPGLIAEQMIRAGVRLEPIPGLVPGRRDYLTSARLRKLVRRDGVRVIHTHDLHGMIDGSICRLTIPSLRFVHTFHFGNYPHRILRHQLIERSLWRIADALVAVSHSQAEAISRFHRIPRDRIRVIWNGVNEPVQSSNPIPFEPPLPDGVPIIASVSTLIAQKGLKHLLDAARLMHDSGVRFVIVVAGDGPLRQELIARAAELGLDECVRFLGWVPQAVSRLLPACDVFVQSSLWEAMSIVVLEAMAVGKAMVVTSVGENPRVIIDGESGLMVPPADSEALAQSLITVIRNPDLRARLGSAARARYLSQFTVAHMTTEYEKLYLELAGAST